MPANIIFIMSDDHAAAAVSAYDGKINQTPQLDRLAREGVRFDNCFCTNSICTPSRAVILTGLYSHLNGVKTLADKIDGTRPNVAKNLQAAGYQTAIVGKWHLGHGGSHDPTGFDYWNILPGQGEYFDPEMIEMGYTKRYSGYATDIITDKALEWLDERDRTRPFFLMIHHKAPHRPWQPDAKHAHMYEDETIPEPYTFNDDYQNRAAAAKAARMRIDRDLNAQDLKQPIPDGLSQSEEKSWKYQRYIKDYLRCVASIDDNVGRLLDYLDAEALSRDTVVMYTSDQGFFLGEHGWFDKRFMYEESLRMPFMVRYPAEIVPSTVVDAMALNVDFTPTFLDFAQVEIPPSMQGSSLRPLMNGKVPETWQTSMYYRYWMHMDPIHGVYSHYGVRTLQYKLIYYYAQALGTKGSTDDPKPPEWELFDLEKDPWEIRNVFHDPAYADVVKELQQELGRLRTKVQDDE